MLLDERTTMPTPQDPIRIPTLVHSAVALALLCMAPAAVHAEALGCLIEPSQVADVGSEVIGVLDKLHVNRGDIVERGQPLAELDAKVERAALAAAETRAKAVSELKAAYSNHEFARRKKERTEDLFSKNFVSEQANDQAATEARIAEHRYRQAREQVDVANRELSLAQAQLARRTIRSPIAGVVVERYLSAGERVEQKPVVKVAAIDPLNVEVFVPATQFNSVTVGRPALVRPELPGLADKTAKVILVDRVIDPASNTFRVRLEMPNPDSALPAGLRCKVDFTGKGFEQPVAQSAQPARKPAPQVANKK